MNRVEGVIKQLLKKPKFKYMHLPDINKGWCYEFTNEIINQVPKAQSIIIPGHALIKFKNKFYDAECFQGVNSINELPIMKRKKLYKNNIANVINDLGDVIFTAREIAWRTKESIDFTVVQLQKLLEEKHIEIVGINTGKFNLYKRVQKKVNK